MKPQTNFSVLLAGFVVAQVCNNKIFAQNEVDALRYSRAYLSGTARYTAMAGSFGALGADFSNLAFNPAGVALYRKSELTFTPSIYAGNSIANFNGASLSNNKYGFNIGNAGLVIGSYWGSEKKSGWLGSGVALGYNRVASFHNRIDIEGNNSTSSFLDMFVSRLNQGNGTPVDQMNPMDEELLWNTYLINPAGLNDTLYYMGAVQSGANIIQRKNIESSGSMGEWLFALGGNYSNRLYLGATVAVPTLFYKETSSYQEILQDVDTLLGLKQYSFNQEFTTQGYGFNFKFGFIYRINDWVRFGGAVHTPSFLHLRDDYANDVKSEFDGGYEYSSDAKGAMDYQLSTPLKFTSSIGFLVQKHGSINIDYEFIDYGESRLGSSYYKYFDENKAIDTKYSEANNIKIGTEWLLDVVSIRAGAGLYGSPYKKGFTDASAIVYSGGFGLRDEGYFLDFGYSYTGYKERYYLYDPARVPATDLNLYSHNFVVTLGYKF